MKTILAIDPGSSGGLAVRFNEATVCQPMPETPGDVLDALRTIRAGNPDCVCYLEKVGGYCGAGQPGSAMFKFGEGFGFIQGALAALGVRVILVRPQEWQKRLGLGGKASCASKSEWKNKLKAEAQRRFPTLDVTLKTADALLLLDYAVEREGRGNAILSDSQ